MIAIDIDKAKAIGHEIRRNKRSDEFAPLDEQIAKQIPGINVEMVEAQRQKIRDKYAEMQTKIDDATNTDDIKSALGI